METIEKIVIPSPPKNPDDVKRAIWKRDPKTFGRAWVAPGTKGLAHRIGGIEKDIETGDISYEAANHQAMSEMRENKVESVADFIPAQSVEQGNESGPLVVVGWGSTYGAIWRAVESAREQGFDVAQVHLRYLNPLPKNLGALLRGYDKVLLPEMNMGQCATLLRDKLEIDVIPLHKVTGQPFKIAEICDTITGLMPAASATKAAE